MVFETRYYMGCELHEDYGELIKSRQEEAKENITIKEQDYNHIQVLQNHIQRRIKDLFGHQNMENM